MVLRQTRQPFEREKYMHLTFDPLLTDHTRTNPKKVKDLTEKNKTPKEQETMRKSLYSLECGGLTPSWKP